MRITRDQDLTTAAGLDVGLKAVRSDGPTMAWVSIPCTGGSILQAANAHHPGAAKRMAAHLKLFRALWAKATTLMDAVLASGGPWPFNGPPHAPIGASSRSITTSKNIICIGSKYMVARLGCEMRRGYRLQAVVGGYIVAYAV